MLPLALLLLACRIEVGPPDHAGPALAEGQEPAGEVWIYTSMYQSVIDQIDPLLREAHPGIEPRWYQAGSEKVAQRTEAEWEAGGTKACLLLTSDPFWYADLKERGELTPYVSPAVLRQDRSLIDLDGYWSVARISLMVLAVNEERIPVEERPARMRDFAEPAWKDRFSMGDPLASGTMFTSLAFLQAEGGWEHFDTLRDNGLIAAGGNSSVLGRIETGERPAGMLLLENLLKAAEKDSPAVPVFPEDGAITIPGPIALTDDCPNPAAARVVYDFLVGPTGQQAMTAGWMYAADPRVPPPAGAPALQDIPLRAWPEGFVEEVSQHRGELKDTWARRVQAGGQ